MIKQHGHRCVICGSKLVDFFMTHHIIPRHRGGNNNYGNLISVCPICHKIIHILENSKYVSDSIDRYIKKNMLAVNLYEYTAHLDCPYFADFLNGGESDLLAEWI